MATTITFQSNSMWTSTPVYDLGDAVITGLLVPTVVPDRTDASYTVSAAAERRLDLISALWYGTPALWWVIAMVNNMLDPISGIRRGSMIRIPTRNRLVALGLLS